MVVPYLFVVSVHVILCILLVLVIQGLVGSSTVTGVMLVIGLTGWAGVARLVRAEVIRVRAEPFVEAARGLGASDRRILFAHVLPHAASPEFQLPLNARPSNVVLLSGKVDQFYPLRQQLERLAHDWKSSIRQHHHLRLGPLHVHLGRYRHHHRIGRAPRRRPRRTCRHRTRRPHHGLGHRVAL